MVDVYFMCVCVIQLQPLLLYEPTSTKLKRGTTVIQNHSSKLHIHIKAWTEEFTCIYSEFVNDLYYCSNGSGAYCVPNVYCMCVYAEVESQLLKRGASCSPWR